MDLRRGELHLVDEAKKGNLDAFNELIKKHRMQAINWAEIITKDSYLAEDVAQDVMLRSYLHLDTLENSDRFLPWLRKMVRNRAIDYVRRKHRDPSLHEEYTDVPDEFANPEFQVLTNEIKDSIQELSQSLTERNKQMFEAHFFHQMAPAEIAKQHHTTTANVYNILSRSKLKLREMRFKKETERYISERLLLKKSTKSMVTPIQFQSTYTSLGHVIYEMVKYDSTFSLSEVMGYTGQAFRTQATSDIGLSSSLIYDWGWVLGRIARTFGTNVDYCGRPNRMPTPELLHQSLSLIHHSIDQGNPALVWNLTSCEFGIIHGYNDRMGTFNYCDATCESSQILYEKLGRTTEIPELFVAFINVKYFQRPDLFHTLETIVLHARGKEPMIAGYSQGLSAYDSWILAFEEDCADEIGHAYNLALLTEAREHAILFLQGLIGDAKIKQNKELILCLNEAFIQYKQVHQTCLALYPSFPYGLPGVKVDNRDRIITLLKKAKKYEEKGIEIFERILSKKSSFK